MKADIYRKVKGSARAYLLHGSLGFTDGARSAHPRCSGGARQGRVGVHVNRGQGCLH